MKDKITIDYRTEKYLRFVMDIVVNILCCLVITVFFIAENKIGSKNFTFINFAYVGLVMLFMITFEQYEFYVSSFWEKTVSFTLSGLLSVVVVSAVNLVFFRSLQLFLINLLLFAAALSFSLVTNFIFSKVIDNEKYFRKPKLLIVAGKMDDISRMKRVKYGTLAQYDSWYELLNTDNLDELDKYMEEKVQGYDEICLFDNVKDEMYEIVVDKAMKYNKDLYVVPKVVDVSRIKTKFARLDDVPALYIPNYSLNVVEEFFKRVMDLVFGIAGGIIAFIPMIIIAAAIKLTSPGPVFYKQLRLTKNKKEFYIYKFRTMVPDAEKKSGPMFAQKDDPRITKVGKILRSCRLDELPQIINIIKGDMSIVGPRPERPFFVEQFEKEIDDYDYRFVVKAGLTSLSHVYGRYSTYILDRTCYDLLYISDYSLLLDIKIILLTAKIMFLKDASEGEDEFKISMVSKEQITNSENQEGIKSYEKSEND